jgi:TorA maturation chaperone TorD
MMRNEKETFCMLAASLLAPPDEHLLADLEQRDLRAFLEEHISEWGGNQQVLMALFKEGDSGGWLHELQKAYDRLFGEYGEKQVSLVESTYKTWTKDKGCGVVFAASTGLIMGDCAIHLLDIYRQLSLEVPKNFRSTPDHVILELEFLALLFRHGTPAQIQQFIKDHLDWIPNLREEVERAQPDPFYSSVLAIIDIFLKNEKQNGSVNHGEKTIH